MNTDIKSDGVKTRKVDIKIPKSYHLALDVYAKNQKTSVTKIVDKLISDFLDQEDVKKIVEQNSKLSKKREALKKKKDEISKLEAEIAAMESEENN